MCLDNLLDEGSHVGVLFLVCAGHLVTADVPFAQVEGNVDGLANLVVVHVANDIGIVETGSVSHQRGVLAEEVKDTDVLLRVVDVLEAGSDSWNTRVSPCFSDPLSLDPSFSLSLYLCQSVN